MALKENITDEDLAVLEILEDPQWCGEFLRSTNNGDTNKERWARQPFRYRWYQSDWLSDTTPNIVVTAGRAVGKTFAPSYSNV